MRIAHLTPFAAAALALAAVGCQDGAPMPMAPDAPALNFSNGPAAPGKSGVLRSQSMEVFGTVDGGFNFIAAHHAPDAPRPFGCGGADLPVYEGQSVNNPAGISNAVTQVDDAPIYIYDFQAFLAALAGDLCGFLADDWLYQGTHDLILTGDFSGGGKTLGWRGHGNVVDQNGDRFRYNEHQHAVIANDGSVDWKSETISVHPTGN